MSSSWPALATARRVHWHRPIWRAPTRRSIRIRARTRRACAPSSPLDLAIQNQIDRFSLAIDVIDRVPALHVAGAHAKEALRNQQIACQHYAYEHGIDMPEIEQWTWPY